MGALVSARQLRDVRETVAELVDGGVPDLPGRAESLNLSTAAAVCLYASARAQRRTAEGAA